MMSKNMHPSNWQTEAEQAYELLAEKDKTIEFIKQRNKDLNSTIDNLHLQLDEEGAEITRLHGNLNECTERGAEAERKLVDESHVALWYYGLHFEGVKAKHKLMAKLKTATDALKDVRDNGANSSRYRLVGVAKKALADIEGEKNLVQNSEDLTTADWYEPEIEKPNLFLHKELMLHALDNLAKAILGLADRK